MPHEIAKQLLWPDVSEPGEMYYRAGPLATERARELARKHDFKRKTVVSMPSEDLAEELAADRRWDCE